MNVVKKREPTVLSSCQPLSVFNALFLFEITYSLPEFPPLFLLFDLFLLLIPLMFVRGLFNRLT
jgi:hypothetical protein